MFRKNRDTFIKNISAEKAFYQCHFNDFMYEFILMEIEVNWTKKKWEKTLKAKHLWMFWITQFSKHWAHHCYHKSLYFNLEHSKIHTYTHS